MTPRKDVAKAKHHVLSNPIRFVTSPPARKSVCVGRFSIREREREENIHSKKGVD